jgi:hypothetical protein
MERMAARNAKTPGPDFEPLIYADAYLTANDAIPDGDKKMGEQNDH